MSPVRATTTVPPDVPPPVGVPVAEPVAEPPEAVDEPVPEDGAPLDEDAEDDEDDEDEADEDPAGAQAAARSSTPAAAPVSTLRWIVRPRLRVWVGITVPPDGRWIGAG
ncbi:hypothetical protein GCM10011594_02840 [Nakamurella endophytica]|uniref:Uncharacterized protein n=1 Tax=Nakamurella endophytica TaxID=1748367 RepID=A0A917WBB9_9ACTN|nr:hypothetical protein GCM10011594_02840 [Nakamurella endophytica]